jgi:hypothetical protein
VLITNAPTMINVEEKYKFLRYSRWADMVKLASYPKIDVHHQLEFMTKIKGAIALTWKLA